MPVVCVVIEERRCRSEVGGAFSRRRKGGQAQLASLIAQLLGAEMDLRRGHFESGSDLEDIGE